MAQNVFIFQSIPERYDLRSKLIEGKQDTWYATRYRGVMNPGDIVFFWMAGEDSVKGLYGWGHLVSRPYIKNDWETYGVDVEYNCRFRQPVRRDEVQKDTSLARMLLFRAPQATNFLLTEDEARNLEKLLAAQGYRTPVLELSQ